MGRLLYSVTMSLDGFIAGPGGDMSWLTEHLRPNPTVDELIDRIGALLVGKGTFDGDDPHKGNLDKAGKPFGGGWDGPQLVLTHHPPDTPGATNIRLERIGLTDAPHATNLWLRCVDEGARLQG